MSVDFSWNTATSVPLLNLTREERAFGWPVFFSLKRIALLQHPDLDPAEPGNWRVRKSQDVLEQALRQAVLSGSLDAIAKAKLVEQDSVAWGDDGVQRIVQGTRTVETHEIAALALLNWFNEQDITPSEHMRAWFDATGASFAVLWKEKNEKYMHPGKEADRFAERNFLEGYEDVTNKLHRGTENSPFDHGEPSPDRCAELARLPSLDAEDWIELTGVGLGKVGHYIVSIEGVRFSEWPEEMIKEVATTEGQRQMLRDNKTPALSFPCSTDELMLFVDSETADGTRFDLPEAFRLARSELQVKTGLGESLSSLESKKSSVQEKTEVDVSTVRSPAKRRRGRKPSAAPVLLDDILEALEDFAASIGEPFDRQAMPGPIGDEWGHEGSFHWLCAKIDPAFKRAKTTFEKHRYGICAVGRYATPTDFYLRALPVIAPKLREALRDQSTQGKARKTP